MINLTKIFNRPEEEVTAAIGILEARLKKRLEALKEIERLSAGLPHSESLEALIASIKNAIGDAQFELGRIFTRAQMRDYLRLHRYWLEYDAEHLTNEPDHVEGAGLV